MKMNSWLWKVLYIKANPLKVTLYSTNTNIYSNSVDSRRNPLCSKPLTLTKRNKRVVGEQTATKMGYTTTNVGY